MNNFLASVAADMKETAKDYSSLRHRLTMIELELGLYSDPHGLADNEPFLTPEEALAE